MFKSPLLKSSSVTDGTYHIMDVQGLSANEYERVKQLTDVFGSQVEIMKAPAKAGPDQPWVIAYKNHTVNPALARERGVILVHLRPSGKIGMFSEELRVAAIAEPDPTMVKILSEAGFEKEEGNSELYLYNLGPWFAAFDINTEGAEPAWTFFDERKEDKEIPFSTPDELKEILTVTKSSRRLYKLKKMRGE
jgi:hypothetical protein